MKTVFVSLVSLLLFTLLWSAPLRNVPTVLEQPDGSKYPCFMTGDEYYHRAHDANGFTIIKNLDTGWNVYAQKLGPDLSPTTYIPGKDDPAARGLVPNLMPDESILRQRVQNWRGTGRDKYGRAPTIGAIENICIFVRFAGETEFGDALQLYGDMHNSSIQASLRGYFLEESAGQLTVNSTFYPTAPGTMVLSWQDANPRNYYYPQSPSNPIGYPPGPVADPDRFGWIRLHTMFANVVNFIAPMIPPGLIIDADGDAQVDNVSFICRGAADATSALFWPHSWQMNTYPAVPLAFINMFQAVDYNFNLQYPDPMYVGYGGGIDPALVCHEFSHTLGFPDLYHYTWSGVNPCGYWDLMDTCYQVPQHHLAYMKWKYGGWFATAPMLPASGACALSAVYSNPFSCYRYFMPTGEEIWMEYRKALGYYETRVPNSGLIFYRVDQAYYPWGNGGGPPDEVYVYRPYVPSSPPDGNINWAAFAWEQSMTAFNQSTDPNPFSQSMPGFVAPLNIHSIETNTGPQMNFVVGTVIPVIWRGTTDTNWYNPLNWSTGMVPTATDFVIIPPVGGWFQCQVPLLPMPAVCFDLRNEFMLTVLPVGTLQVGNNFTSIGRFFQNGFTQVTGNFTISNWYAGSWLQCTSNPGAQLTIGGNCTFDPGTQIQMQVGQLIFANIGVSPPISTFVSNSWGAVLFDLVVNKTGTTLDYTSMFPGMPINILGSLNVLANSTFVIRAPHFINITGNLTSNPPGVLQVQDVQNICTFVFVGPPGLQTINMLGASYLLHLDVQNNAAPMLASSLDVRGNFTITLGTFIANNNFIFVRGNWTNNVGLGGFQKGTSRVVFCAPAVDQTITVLGTIGAAIENFYILELNKAAGSLNMNTAMQQVQCDFYDWNSGMLKVTDGLFTALSLLDNCVRGNFTCNFPGMMNLTDTSGNGDLYANLLILGGTITVLCPTAGAGSLSNWGLNPGSLQMNGGTLIYQNCGISIQPGSTFSANITSGAMIQVAGDFYVQRPEFAPTSGVVYVNSPFPPANVGTSSGGAFFDLRLGTSVTNTSSAVLVNGTLFVSGSCVFNVSSPLTVNGNLQLTGILNMTAPVAAVVQGTAGFPAGSLLDVRNANFTLAGQYSITLDGMIMIENGWLDATNHPITISPTGSIVFGAGGSGFTGKLSCATVTANTGGTFVQNVGTLELKGNVPAMVYAMSFASGNWVNNLIVNHLTSVQLMTNLLIKGNLQITSGQLVMDNTGRTIAIQGSWTNSLPGTGFVKGTSIVDFSGSGTASISTSGAAEQFYALNVSSGTLILMNNVSASNVLNIGSATLQVNGKTLSVVGNTTVNTGGLLDLDSGSVMETGNSKQVIIIGSLQSIGVAGNLATMRGQAGANWNLIAQAGSNIAAKYTDFRHLRSTGVTVLNGATVNTASDFDNCVFRDGASSATFLTVNNNQTLNITGISFPTSISGGYNIAKTVNAGTVNVLSSSGSFAGPLYENDSYARINWTGYDPNLIVQTFTVSNTDPYVADQVSYSVVIKNDSANPVQTPFKIHLFKNRATAPGWTETGDYNYTCPTLLPGATCSHTFTGVFSMTAGAWTSWLLIDPEGAIQETNETDNIDSEALTWHALPAVSSMSFSKTGSSTGRLSWTYPIWVSRYKVYDSNDPYGTYSQIGSTTNTYYDVTLGSTMRFYLVKAERDAPAK